MYVLLYVVASVSRSVALLLMLLFSLSFRRSQPVHLVPVINVAIMVFMTKCTMLAKRLIWLGKTVGGVEHTDHLRTHHLLCFFPGADKGGWESRTAGGAEAKCRGVRELRGNVTGTRGEE